MRAAKYLWLVAPIVAACGDVSGPTAASPRGPAFTTMSTNLIVRGFTTDAYFHRYSTSPSYFDTGNYTFYWNRTAGLDSVTVTRMSSYEYTSMNGGETEVMATVDGVLQSLGTVSGDMQAEMNVFTIPSDGYVTLQAYPNTGCRFLFWEDENNNRIYGNPLTVTPGSGLLEREAWYQCGTLH